MDIKLELLSGFICDTIRENFNTLKINPRKIIDTKAVKILGESKTLSAGTSLMTLKQ